MRKLRRALLVPAVVVLALASLGGCQPPEEAARPDTEEVRALLMRVLGEGREEPPPRELFAVSDNSGEVVRYVPAGDDEMAALWRPPALESIAIEEVRCQWFPVWRIAYKPTLQGKEGGLLVSEVVPVGDELRVLMRWREAREAPDGTLVPDFSPHGHGRSDNLEGRPKLMVIVQTTWTDLRIDR